MVRVFRPKFPPFFEALQRYQFTDNEDCEHLDERTAGRTFVSYAASRDFLGAKIDTSSSRST